MTSKRLGIFIVASILLHVVLIVFYQFIAPLLPEPVHIEKAKTVKVTLVPPKPTQPPLQPSKPIPQESMFVDTPTGETAKETDPNTPLESDRATNASSQNAGTGSTFLPNQTGVKVPGLNLVNTPRSIDNQGEQSPTPSPQKPDPTVAKAEPQPPKPEEQPKPEPKEKPDPKLPVDPKEPKQAPQVKPFDTLPIRPEADIQVTKAQPEETKKPDPNPTPKTQQPPQNASPRSPPTPTQFSALKQQNTINGGAPMGPTSSVEAKDTDLGRYKAKLFRGIGSRWYLYVQQDNGLLGVGNVKIRFYVRSDGVITNLEIVQGKQNAQLAAISRRSIMEISGQLEPFSDSLKLQLGDGYMEEVTFSIY